MAAQGMFIVLEGGDGAGKSTQIIKLRQHLENLAVPCITTREPGATPLGKELRRMLVDPDGPVVSAKVEALLFAADRSHHVDTVIRPALNKGVTVICDRYIDSSVAYQGVARGLAIEEIRELSRWATNGLKPDATFVLDVDPRIGLERVNTTEYNRPDKFESESIHFANKVRASFLATASNSDSHHVIDASQDPNAVHSQIAAILAGKLSVPHSR